MSNVTETLSQMPPRSAAVTFKKYARVLITGLILLACLVGVSGQFDRYTHRMVDDSLVQAGVTFSVVKGSSMLISTLKGAELGLGPFTLRVGEMLEPINEALVYTSHIIMMSIASLGIQKVLLGIFGSHFGNALLVMASLIVLVSLWLPRFKHYQLAAKKIFLTTFFIRYSLALVVVANTLVDHLFLHEQIQSNEQQIELFESQLDKLPEEFEQAQEQLEEEKGLWQKTKDKFSELRPSMSSMTDGIADIPERFDKFVTNFMNLIALYLLKTILIPLAFLWCLKRVFQAMFNVDVTSLFHAKTNMTTQ